MLVYGWYSQDCCYFANRGKKKQNFFLIYFFSAVPRLVSTSASQSGDFLPHSIKNMRARLIGRSELCPSLIASANACLSVIGWQTSSGLCPKTARWRASFGQTDGWMDISFSAPSLAILLNIGQIAEVILRVWHQSRVFGSGFAENFPVQSIASTH